MRGKGCLAPSPAKYDEVKVRSQSRAGVIGCGQDKCRYSAETAFETLSLGRIFKVHYKQGTL